MTDIDKIEPPPKPQPSGIRIIKDSFFLYDWGESLFKYLFENKIKPYKQPKLSEGNIKKGGVNDRPTTKRPSSPIGQKPSPPPEPPPVRSFRNGDRWKVSKQSRYGVINMEIEKYYELLEVVKHGTEKNIYCILPFMYWLQWLLPVILDIFQSNGLTFKKNKFAPYTYEIGDKLITFGCGDNFLTGRKGDCVYF